MKEIDKENQREIEIEKDRERRREREIKKKKFVFNIRKMFVMFFILPDQKRCGKKTLTALSMHNSYDVT